MNPNLALLQPYPFEKLAALKAGVQPRTELKPIDLSIGEPRHPTPQFLMDVLTANLAKIAVYPTTRGLPELRSTIADWLSKRFFLPVNSLNPQTQILPVNGTREALFALAQAVIATSSRSKHFPLVIMPNPFYQIYEGAAMLANAMPYFLPCTKKNEFIPNFNKVSSSVWERCQLLYICSPGNPTGAVLNINILQQLIKLADQYDFIIASDECYSEIYRDEANPPPGLLQAAAELGRTDYRRCVVFHSLSKRSNCPGLRSGFVAGDAKVIEQFLLYRTYHGCAMPLHVQAASMEAWKDEAHVRENRNCYREKFIAVSEILQPVLSITIPDAGFYLWIETPKSDIEFTKQLFATQNVTLLPGSFLSREINGTNPGYKHIRMALTPPLDDCIEAAQRIRQFVEYWYLNHNMHLA